MEWKSETNVTKYYCPRGEQNHEKEVLQVIILKTKKVAGIKSIIWEVLIHWCSWWTGNMACLTCCVWRLCLTIGLMGLFLLYSKGKIARVNYRGVSLLSVPGTSFGKILTEFYKKNWAKFEMFGVSLAVCFPADHWEMWEIKLAVHLLFYRRHMK